MTAKHKSLVAALFCLSCLAQLTSGCRDKEDPPADQEITVTDVDGNTYKTIKIGNSVWVRENLKTTHYRNGDIINTGTKLATRNTDTEGYFYNYNNNESIAGTYGRLYDWYALNDPRGLAPAGCHIATNEEWEAAVEFLGGNEVAGGKMKEAGQAHWTAPNAGADNSSGFTGLPAGIHYINGFDNLGYNAFYWTSTSMDDISAMAWVLSFDKTSVSSGNYYKTGAFSVRCVMD